MSIFFTGYFLGPVIGWLRCEGPRMEMGVLDHGHLCEYDFMSHNQC
uniref:Uncharacterized protein n=1 Tax=Fusarium oxysporum (strain Fo5176) TaxID=660025 RepID=A0A0D2XEJ5_FUSOF